MGSGMPNIDDLLATPGNKRALDLKRACATFYVLEMAAAKMPGSPAATAFEAYVSRLAPDIARCLEYSCSTEIRFYRDEGSGELGPGSECPDCWCDSVELTPKGKYLKCGDGCECNGSGCANGCDSDGEVYDYETGGWKKCPKHKPGKKTGCGWRMPYKQTDAPVEEPWDFYQSYGWKRAVEEYGLEWYSHAAIMFHDEERWAPGFGGGKWGTIADVLRDYLHGRLRPQTFLDRAWTLQHNNASVFDKAFSINGLMTVLAVQADNDYQRLLEWTEPYVQTLWERVHRHEMLYRRYDPEARRDIVPAWVGTGD